MKHTDHQPDSLFNLKEPYFLCEVFLRAPWWTVADIWPRRHVYFARHLRLCDLAKKELVRRRILRIGRYFVQKVWITYHHPMRWRERLRIRIFLRGLLKEGRIPLLTYELHSHQKNDLLAEVYLLYHPPLSLRAVSQLFFDEALKKNIMAILPSES